VGYKILLADDSVTVQKIITLTFSDEGVDVLTVNNGDEAIHRLQYMRPALVMADVSIPGKNGYEICEFVKTHPDMKDTPVVLLVPAFEPFDEERARRIGANQHLTKPFQSIRTLISTVKGLLESHPPKISAPPSTGPLTVGAPLGQPAEQPKAVAAATQAPAADITQPDVPSTRPFPADAEEESPLVAAEVVEEVVVVEAESPQPEPEPVLEMEPAPEAEPELPAAASADQDEEVVREAEPSIPAVPPPTAEPIVAEETSVTAATAHDGLATDLDHVLDLDDVLPEVWAPPTPVAEAVPVSEPPQSVAANDELSPSPQVAIPQTVIDEIVNRVVAQLSEKLTQKLALQLAPEVAEIVKQQTQPDLFAQAPTIPSSARRESGSLLELD
jgi:CheY-like chemotaxis protein